MPHSLGIQNSEGGVQSMRRGFNARTPRPHDADIAPPTRLHGTYRKVDRSLRCCRIASMLVNSTSTRSGLRVSG